MFAGPAGTMGPRVHSDLQVLLSFPTTLSPCSLQTSLVIALFWEQGLYLKSLGG